MVMEGGGMCVELLSDRDSPEEGVWFHFESICFSNKQTPKQTLSCRQVENSLLCRAGSLSY